MRSAKNRREAYFVDKFATAYDTDMWTTCEVGTGAVSISSGELKLDCPADTDVAALVSKHAWYLRNCRISVDVDVATDAVARSGIILAKTKVTTSNPESENDILQVCLDQVNDKVLIKSNVDGAGAKTLLNTNWTDGDGTLKIDIEPDGFYTCYEDTTAKYVGSVPFTETATPDIFHLYIYLYAYGTAALAGAGMLDNFQLDWDAKPTADVEGAGVRLASLRNNTPVWGRLIDHTHTADLFETDHAYTDTPTQRVVLSRDVQKFQLEELRCYFDDSNNGTSGLAFYGAAKATDIESYSHMSYKTGDNTSVADATVINKTPNDSALPATFILERPGQVWFNQDFSAAPGNVTGYLILVGKEVE